MCGDSSGLQACWGVQGETWGRAAAFGGFGDFYGRNTEGCPHCKGQVGFILTLNRSSSPWLWDALESLLIDRDVCWAEASLGQWIHREVRILFYTEPTFCHNCIMMSLIPRPSSPAVSLGIYSRYEMPFTI